MKKKIGSSVVAILLLLLIWEVAARIMNRSGLFPSAWQVIQTLALLFVSASFYTSVGLTILRGLAGILLSIVSAALFAFLFSRYRWLYNLFRPLLTTLRSIPVISFILLALIFLHPESIPLLIAFLVMFPLLTENFTKGILNLQQAYSDMAKTFLIRSRNKLLHIYYPQLKPFIFSGLASAMGFGWRAIIMGEVLAQCTYGIGSEMKRAQLFIEVPELIAWTCIAILISYLFDTGISRLEQCRPPLSYSSIHTTITSVGDIELSGISFAYGDKQIFSNASFRFEKGKVYGISAPSGKGKTTLLNIVSGLLIPDKGSVSIPQKQGIAYVMQEPVLLPHLSVQENVLLPLTGYYKQEEAQLLATEVLSEMELIALRDTSPKELSYGQQQRVAIARALVFPSSVLLMDEPFKGLDEKLVSHIIDHIQKKQTTHPQTILFASHQQEELKALADTVILL